MAVTRRLMEAMMGVRHPLLNTLRKAMYVDIKRIMLDTEYLHQCFNGYGLNSNTRSLVVSGSAVLPGTVRSYGDLDISMHGGKDYNSEQAEEGVARVIAGIARAEEWFYLETGVREREKQNITPKQRKSRERKSPKWQYFIEAERIQRFYMVNNFTAEVIKGFIKEGVDGPHQFNIKDIEVMQAALDGDRISGAVRDSIHKARRDRCNKNGSLGDYEGTYIEDDVLAVHIMVDTASLPASQIFTPVDNEGNRVAPHDPEKTRLLFREPLHDVVLEFLSLYTETGTRNPRTLAKRAYDLYLRLPMLGEEPKLELDDIITRHGLETFVNEQSPLFAATARILLATQGVFIRGQKYRYITEEQIEQGLNELADENVINLGNDSVKDVARKISNAVDKIWQIVFGVEKSKAIEAINQYAYLTPAANIRRDELKQLITTYLEEVGIREAEKYGESFADHMHRMLVTVKTSELGR